MGREPTSLGDAVVLSSNMMMEHTSNTQVCLLSKLCLQLENSRGEVKLDAGIRVNFNNVVDDGDNLRPVRRYDRHVPAPATTQLGEVSSLGVCTDTLHMYGYYRVVLSIHLY